MKMAELHAERYGTEPKPRGLTNKEREMLRADPAFAEWLDQLTASAVNEQETNDGDQCDRFRRR